jgi:hypothetical protein
MSTNEEATTLLKRDIELLTKKFWEAIEKENELRNRNIGKTHVKKRTR